jgi:hypothetical protein
VRGGSIGLLQRKGCRKKKSSENVTVWFIPFFIVHEYLHVCRSATCDLAVCLRGEALTWERTMEAFEPRHRPASSTAALAKSEKAKAVGSMTLGGEQRIDQEGLTRSNKPDNLFMPMVVKPPYWSIM